MEIEANLRLIHKCLDEGQALCCQRWIMISTYLRTRCRHISCGKQEVLRESSFRSASQAPTGGGIMKEILLKLGKKLWREIMKGIQLISSLMFILFRFEYIFGHCAVKQKSL